MRAGPSPTPPTSPTPREGFASIDNACLYYRDVGRGSPIVVLHGGPDFDHHYLKRLYEETWVSSRYDLLPRAALLRLPTLVIHGEHDLVPVDCAAHVAQAIPGARLVVLKDCGHFSYLERPDEVRRAIADLLRR